MAGYIGSSAAVSTSGVERKKTFAITTSTSALTGVSYTPNFVHVFHNGIRLVDGTDYTATNGTSVTLVNAAESGDEVVVVSYATFSPADAYTKAEADAEFLNDPASVITVSGSNVGIGTSSPSQKLMTDGNIFASTGDGGGFILEGGNAILRQNITSMAFNTNSAERIRIDSNGNVTVKAGKELRVNRPDDATYGAISHGASGTGIVYNDLNGDGHHWQFAGSEKMRLDGSGIKLANGARVRLPISLPYNVTYDTGISVNGGSSARGLLVMMTGHTSDGMNTQSALYLVRCGYDGNNTPVAEKIGGTYTITVGKSANNTITLYSASIPTYQIIEYGGSV